MPTAKTPRKRKSVTGKTAAPKSHSAEVKAGKAAKAARGKVVGDGGLSKNNGKGAPKGNQFWRARSKHGKDKIFKDAETLWTACTEYFDWCEANPLLKEKKMLSGGRLRSYKEKTPRPFTIIGLCMFIGINRATWAQNYRTHKDYISVCSQAEDAIRDQKFSGAAVGHFNAGIIARDLGMEDRTVVDDTGAVDASAAAEAAEEIVASITSTMTDKEAARVYKEFTAKRRAHTRREQT
jgi:hypothetical protein